MEGLLEAQSVMKCSWFGLNYIQIESHIFFPADSTEKYGLLHSQPLISPQSVSPYFIEEIMVNCTCTFNIQDNPHFFWKFIIVTSHTVGDF